VEVAHYSREAQEALARKDFEGARAALEKLAQLTPEVAEVLGNLGIVYYSENRFSRAADALQRALKLNPKLPDAELMLGICFAELSRNAEAVSILEPAFRSPPNPQIGRLIGIELQRAYALLGQHAKADDVTNELMRRYPDDAEILYDSARLYSEQTSELLKRLVEVAPNSVWVHLAFAQVHESGKHYDYAVSDYRNALRIDPQLRGGHFNIGRDLLLSGETELHRKQALKEFEQELALNPQNPNAEYELGEIYRRAGQLQQALEHFSKAVEYSPDFEDGQIGLGRTLIGLDKPREALPHLLEAVRLNPHNEVSHFLLARVYKLLQDKLNEDREMTLFQKYRIRTPATGSVLELPPEVTTPQITKQTLGSEASSQP
jgi:tetratricopeptide (TPR) repeat protein